MCDTRISRLGQFTSAPRWRTRDRSASERRSAGWQPAGRLTPTTHACPARPRSLIPDSCSRARERCRIHQEDRGFGGSACSSRVFVDATPTADLRPSEKLVCIFPPVITSSAACRMACAEAGCLRHAQVSHSGSHLPFGLATAATVTFTSTDCLLGTPQYHYDEPKISVSRAVARQ